MKSFCQPIAGLLLGTLLLAGCSSTPPARPPYALEVEAEHQFRKPGAKLFWIEENSEKWSKIATVKQARQLGDVMELATTRPIDVACSGPDSPSVRRCILQALDLQVSQLPGLRLLYVGSEKEREAIEKAVHDRGAIFLYAPGEPK